MARRIALRVAREVGLIAMMLVIYNIGRMIASKHTGDAFSNAYSVWHFERAIGLPNEEQLQHAVLGLSHPVVQFANLYYGSVHFPITLAALVFLFVYDQRVYLWMRRSFVMVSLAALVGFLLFPLAPPRMLPAVGFVDTGQAFGQSVYNPHTTTSVTNQFAAMPSLHVAWSVLVAIALICAFRSRWRYLWLAHPIVTLFVVVVTANHYWMDAVVGVAMLLVAMTVAYAQQSPTPEPVSQREEVRTPVAR